MCDVSNSIMHPDWIYRTFWVELPELLCYPPSCFSFSFLYLRPVRFYFGTQWYLCWSCRSQHKCVWALARRKKGVMFRDGKNWFPISSTMTASFPATQAIWPTLLRLLGAVDQGDSCLHLRPHSLRSEKAWKRNVLSIFLLTLSRSEIDPDP